MLEEEELAVRYARRPRAKTTRLAKIGGLGLDRVLILLPIHAIGWIGEHVVKLAILVSVLGQRIAEGDLLRIMARHQHVGLADTERFAV